MFRHSAPQRIIQSNLDTLSSFITFNGYNQIQHLPSEWLFTISESLIIAVMTLSPTNQAMSEKAAGPYDTVGAILNGNKTTQLHR